MIDSLEVGNAQPLGRRDGRSGGAYTLRIARELGTKPKVDTEVDTLDSLDALFCGRSAEI
jgi:hypothetical protein